MQRRKLSAIGVTVTFAFVFSACSSLTPESSDAADSGSVSAAGSAAAPAGDGDEAASGTMGGFTPVSDVDAHSKVVEDVCAINGLLDAESIDWDAVRTVYQEGGASVNSDGSVRTIAGFATSERDEAIWNDYVAHFDDPTWIDTFTMSAIDGTGAFAGEADLVRRQGTQKGIQNQVMIAWMLHELIAAQEKVVAGETDPAEGAPHNVDEAWAFYHGTSPDCGPYATANSRGDNYGNGTEVNDALLEHVTAIQAAAVAGDADAYQTHLDETINQIMVTYVQATQRYASKVNDSMTAGDEDTARIEQAEGWAFYKVIEPMVAAADPDVADTVSSFYDLSSPPQAGQADAVRSALESVYADLGITAEMVGTLT